MEITCHRTLGLHKRKIPGVKKPRQDAIFPSLANGSCAEYSDA